MAEEPTRRQVTGARREITAYDQIFLNTQPGFAERLAVTDHALSAGGEVGRPGDATDAPMPQADKMTRGEQAALEIVGKHGIHVQMAELAVYHHDWDLLSHQVFQ
jgi:hypothetical protein